MSKELKEKAVITTELANEFLLLKAKADRESRFWNTLRNFGFSIKSIANMYSISHNSLPLKTSFYVDSDSMTIIKMTLDKASWLYKEDGSPIMTCEDFIKCQKGLITEKVSEILNNINKVVL